MIETAITIAATVAAYRALLALCSTGRPGSKRERIGAVLGGRVTAQLSGGPGPTRPR